MRKSMIKTHKALAIILVLAFVFSICFIFPVFKTSAAIDIPCIPGIQGFGVNTPGGRGGKIIHVTNLNSSGPGSLRDACTTQSGSRIVVFDVSGTIDLTNGGDIRIYNPFITIAGQTAPAPGIQLTNGTFKIGGHDIVIQHIAVRYGNKLAEGVSSTVLKDRDGVKLAADNAAFDLYNVVMDHMSTAWSTDEAGQIWNSSYKSNPNKLHDVTITNSLLAEPLRFAGRPDTIQGGGGYPNYPNGHEFGILIGDTSKNVALIGNFVSDTQTRCPTLKGDTTSFVGNNIFYNNSWRWSMLGSGTSELADTTKAAPIKASFVGNAYLKGPNTEVDSKIFHFGKGGLWYSNDPSASEIFFDDSNRIESGLTVDVTDPTADDYFPQELLTTTTMPVTVPGFTPIPKDKLESTVIANVGARPAFRDSVDQRAINNLINRTGTHVDTPEQVGGWPIYAYNHVPFVEPTNPNGDDDGDGYTNIEEELQRFAAIVEGRAPQTPVLSLSVENKTAADYFKLGSMAKARISVTNNEELEHKVALVVGLYNIDTDKMVAYSASKQIIPASHQVEFEAILRIPSSGNYKVKYFVSDNLNTLTPINGLEPGFIPVK
jgi:hypothetical protein